MQFHQRPSLRNSLAYVASEHLRLLAAQYPEFGVTRAIPFILEIHDPATNKGTALQTICDRLSISPRNCLVFGDGENDIAMFRKAGYSVAMANGMEVSEAEIWVARMSTGQIFVKSSGAGTEEPHHLD